MLIPILFAFYLVFNFLNLFCKFNFLSCLEMEGAGVVAAEQLYQIARKVFPSNDEVTRIMKIFRILKAIMETKNDYNDVLSEADYIANVANGDDDMDSEKPLYISGDDVFDFLYALGFKGNDSEDDDGIDFGDVDI